MSTRQVPVDPDQPFDSIKRHTFVYLVCSPQSRVGKTLTARLLVDYHLSDSRPLLGFDTNHFDPALAAVFPNDTTVIDLGSTRGQMALFDRLIAPDQTAKVVDLWHASFDLFFKQAYELEFFEEAWRQGIEPVVIFLTDQKYRFGREIRKLSAQWDGMKIALVHNEGLTKLQDVMDYPNPSRPYHMLIIPELDVMVRRALDEPNLLLDRLIRQPSPEAYFVIAARVRALLEPFFHQFQMLEVKLGLENASFLG